MKGMEMMKQIYQRIFGVPADRVQAVEVTQRPIEGDEAEFVRESSLNSVIRAAAAEKGFSYSTWRKDPDGEQWYQRLAADSPMPTIQAFAADDAAGDEGGEELEFSEFDIEAGGIDAITRLRRDAAILKAYHQREMRDFNANSDEGFDDE